MKAYGLYLNGVLQGVRVAFFEIGRAYDVSIDLFERWSEGCLNISNLPALELVENDGRFYTADELSKNASDSEGGTIKNYLEFIYDTDVCNLVDFISKFPNIELGKTQVKTDLGICRIVDLDFNLNQLILEISSGVSPFYSNMNIHSLSENDLIY